MKHCPVLLTSLFCLQILTGQTYAGFKSLQLKDSTRIYKPDVAVQDSLYYRPIDLDVWYPSSEKKDTQLTFGDLFNLFEQRANSYQNETDYSGLTSELAQFYVAGLGIDSDGQKLLDIKTNSYKEVPVSNMKHQVVIYLAGFNGMGFENYKILETLAQNGFVVVSISSIGRYPGDMTNEKADMLQQVYDAEFAMNYLSTYKIFDLDLDNIGVLGCSWGGMSAGVLANRNQNIKAMISLDGSETHYFGETDSTRYANNASGEDNDRFIQEIYDSNLLNTENQDISYLYFESGDKLDDFTPTHEYHYFKNLKSHKYYLRFENGTHADFTCIPYILNSSENSVKVYENIKNATLFFFNKALKGADKFQSYWDNLISSDHTTYETYDISQKTVEASEISGQILDSKTYKPLPYVNIGIINGETGTVSRIDGNFILEVNNEFIKDTLRVSSIGYKTVEIQLKELVAKEMPIQIIMEEEISELNEVIITAKAFKRKTLGNKTESKFIGTGFSYNQLGAEMGIKINIRKKPTFVDAFNFNISYNRLSAESVFRLNFYNIKNNRPFENLLKQNILVSITPKQTGKITIDLKPYDIILSEDVIVTLEWVDNQGENNEGEAIFFPLGFLTNGTIYKTSSQAKFKKFSSLGVGFNIDVRY